MTEKQLQQSIVQAARTYGWRDAWTWKSFHSPKGWPDLVLAKGLRLLIVELKSEKGKVTPEQQVWLDWWRAFAIATAKAVGGAILYEYVSSDGREDTSDAMPKIEVHVWRPADLEEALRVLSST